MNRFLFYLQVTDLSLHDSYYPLFLILQHVYSTIIFGIYHVISS